MTADINSLFILELVILVIKVGAKVYIAVLSSSNSKFGIPLTFPL